MLLFLLLIVVSVIGNLWVVSKIWPVSKLYAIATFFFFPAAIFFMFAQWGDEEHDIKVPFVLTLLAAIGTVYLADKLEAEYGEHEEVESRLYESPRHAAVESFGGYVVPRRGSGISSPMS